MKNDFFIFLLLFVVPGHGRAQQKDATLINALVKDIAAAQVATDGEFYAGTFPSFRESGGVPHNYQPDNNIFFTAVGIFAMRNMLPQLDETNKTVATTIIANSQKAFPYYQDKEGRPFYSFWPNGKGILPHSLFIKKIKLIDMGQDADDAVMSLMATDAADTTCSVLKQRMIAVSNGYRKIVGSTYKKYRKFPAYGTYLGLNMPPDFDFGVQCNVLYFMLDRKLQLVKQDSATIHLLAAMLKDRNYIKAPVYISPYYVKRSVLMYHIARLMGRFTIPELELYKPQLVEDIKKELSKTWGIMDKIILSTSLLRLGSEAPAIDIPNIAAFEKSGQDKFIFFQARAAFSYPTPFKQIFLHWGYMCYYFYCPAYNKILWLEYLMERNKQ